MESIHRIRRKNRCLRKKMSNAKTAAASLIMYVAIPAATILSLHASAYGAYQDVTVSPHHLLVSAGNEYEISLVYGVSNGDTSTKGITVGIHYNSASLHFQGFRNIFESEFLGDVGPVDDEDNYDNDVATDKYVAIAWWDPEGNWPNDALPLELARMKFLSLITGPVTIRTTTLCGDPAFTDTAGEANLDCDEAVAELEAVSAIFEAVGGITDRLGNVLPEVTIKTDWAGAGTVSSVIGYFILSVPAGTHIIEVSKPGYAKQHITFDGCSDCLYLIGDIILEALGDLNADARCDLADAIISVRTLAGMDTSDLIRSDYNPSGVDVDGDHRVGLSDLTYMLQRTAEIR